MSYSQTSTPQVAGQQYSNIASAIDGVDRAQVVGVGLYAATLACHWFAAAARWLVVTVVLGVMGWLTHWPIPTHLVAMVVSIGPLAVSVLVLAFPRAVASAVAHCWELLTGGRPPEEREIDAFNALVRRLQVVDPAVRMPMRWFIADCEGCGVEARCGCLRVDRGVLDSPHAAGVIAHALGHLGSLDARLSTALRVLVLAPMGTPSVTPLRSLPLRGLAWVASGQAACWVMRRPWEVYWRSRELAADQHAVELGEGEVLAAFLEQVDASEDPASPGTDPDEPCRRHIEGRITRLRSSLTHPTPAQTNAVHAEPAQRELAGLTALAREA